MTGLATALSEVTLVLFTTLAPSGAVAFAIIAVLIACGYCDGDRCFRAKQFLSVPLITTMAGLIASATHLGNPANALYVFMGVGRSPLSNEVFSAVIFLGLAGSYWLYSFTQVKRPVLERIWLVSAAIAAVVFVDQVSLAYSVETIITWDSPLMPLSLWLNALIGGPLLALCSLRAADRGFATGRFWNILCIVSAAALVGNMVVLVLYGSELAGMRNSLTSALDLAPFYPALAVYGITVAAGIVSMLFANPSGSLLRRFRPDGPECRTGDSSRAELRMLGWCIVSCAMAFFGIFLIRFVFYMLHMTVGLAV
jgi:anaerobic dimethyl sulfoxide reductase subunit C (anchor subunit)